MISPIGISAVNGKHPAEIAVSVAGELIAHYQGQALEQKRPTKQYQNQDLTDQHRQPSDVGEPPLEEKIA